MKLQQYLIELQKIGLDYIDVWISLDGEFNIVPDIKGSASIHIRLRRIPPKSGLKDVT
jgi:hypothetical protein